jgi:alpha-amylase
MLCNRRRPRICASKGMSPKPASWSDDAERRDISPRRDQGLTRLTSLIVLVLVALVTAARPAWGAAQDISTRTAPRNEIFYLIFVRSFRDSNGDSVGDLKGIEQELGYLQDLGVTTIVLTPLYQSPFYHSYFADDFSKVDPAYGNEADFRHMVQALHKRGMKIFIDEEIQYVTSNHAWFRAAMKDPKSPPGSFVFRDGPENTHVETMDLGSYDGSKTPVAMVNLHDPAVLDYQTKLFRYWMNPSDNAGADDGVDGFRIDHMMDDLDNLKKLDNLFTGFWAPLFKSLRSEKPGLRILAEQADWNSYGDDWFDRGTVDMVYAFQIRQSIASFDKKRLTEAVSQTALRTPPGKQQLIFIENHDTDRFATVVDGDLRREKIGASLNLLLKGIPLIYYGQEVGLAGRQRHDGPTDGNDIPVREAFPWTSTVGPGMAVWYKGPESWWTNSSILKGSYPSLEKEATDPQSLYTYYKKLVALRNTRSEFVTGEQSIIENDSPDVFSFERQEGEHRALVLVNLADRPTTVHIRVRDVVASPKGIGLHDVFTGDHVSPGANNALEVSLGGYGVGIFDVVPSEK